jgi:hypothetical protein
MLGDHHGKLSKTEIPLYEMTKIKPIRPILANIIPFFQVVV